MNVQSFIETVTAQDKFASWLGDDLAPWLKERGFRRKDTTFRRQSNDNWQIINVQRSKWADADDVPFTVNLGAGLKVLHAGAPRARDADGRWSTTAIFVAA